MSRSSSLASDEDIRVVTEATPSLAEHWSERDGPSCDGVNVEGENSESYQQVSEGG